MARIASREFKAHLEPLIELLGMEEVIQQVGLKRVLEQVGPQKVIEEMGLDWFLAKLTPAQRRELKRRLR
jgi:hypothetical protein